MEEKKILKNKNKIERYLKKNNNTIIFSVLLENIDNSSIYIALAYHYKTYTYRVFWCDISKISSNKIEDWINKSLIFPNKVDEFKRIIAENGISEDYIDNDQIDSKIIIKSYLTGYEYNKKEFIVKRYIPKCWTFLADALYILFDAMPKFTYSFFQIIIEKLITPNQGILFAFDKQNDDIKKLFTPKDIKLGEKYFEEEKIVFIEKRKNTTSAIIRTERDNLITIINYEDINELQMTCTCSHEGKFCAHIYAAILASQKKMNKPFYKIMYNNNKDNILDNIKNNNFFFCAGIKEDNFIILNDTKFDYLKIADNNKINFKIIEDDKNKTLEKELKKYIKNNNLEEK